MGELLVSLKAHGITRVQFQLCSGKCQRTRGWVGPPTTLIHS